MKLILTSLFIATMCASCASISSPKKSTTNLKATTTQTKIYIAEGQLCSLPPNVASPDQKEFALGAALAAALVPKLVNSGIDALSSALRKASGEDDKDLSVTSNETGAFLYKLGPAKLGAAVNVEKKCIRILVADFPIEHSTNTAPGIPAINATTLDSNTTIESAISNWLGQSSSGVFNPHFYIEYEVVPALGQNFTIEPVLIWYPDQVFGDKYKLVSLELKAQNVPLGEKPAFEYTTIFSQKGGQASGVRLGREDLSGLQKALFKGPALSVGRTTLQANYTQAITDINGQIVLDDNAKMAFDLAKQVALKNALVCMAAANDEDTKGNSVITDDEKISCDLQYKIDIMTAQNSFDIVSNRLTALGTKKKNIGAALFAQDGAINLTFKLTETTKPNKFLLALSDALSSGKTEIEPAISRVFLGPQRSDQDRIDNFGDQWDYQTKLETYSIDKAKYQSLVEQTNPPATSEEIDTAFQAYRSTGRELGELALKLGKPLPN